MSYFTTSVAVRVPRLKGQQAWKLQDVMTSCESPDWITFTTIGANLVSSEIEVEYLVRAVSCLGAMAEVLALLGRCCPKVLPDYEIQRVQVELTDPPSDSAV